MAPAGTEAVLAGDLGGGHAEGDDSQQDGSPVEAVGQPVGLGELGE